MQSQPNGTISVDADLIDQLRIAGACLLASACDDFNTAIGGFICHDDAEQDAWALLPERYAVLVERMEWVRLLGTESSAPAPELPRELVAKLALDAGGDLRDDIISIARDSESGPEATYGEVGRLAARGIALLALAEEAGAYEEAPR